jgi:hypothetical protein
MGRKGIAEELQEKFVKEYTDPESECYHSTIKIGEKYEVGHVTVGRYLKKHGIRLTGAMREHNPKIKKEKPKKIKTQEPKEKRKYRKSDKKPRYDLEPKKEKELPSIGPVSLPDYNLEPKKRYLTNEQVKKVVDKYTLINGPYHLRPDRLAEDFNVDETMIIMTLQKEGVMDKFGRIVKTKEHTTRTDNNVVKLPKVDNNRVTPEEYYKKAMHNIKSELNKIFPKGTIITISFDIEI